MKIETIWNDYRSALEKFLRSRLSNRDDVDDLLQIIFEKSFNNLQSLNSPKKLKSWLFQIANRTLIDFYRARANEQAKGNDISVDDLWYMKSGEDIEGELSRCLLPFINALPPENAELLRMIDLEGKPQKQFAIENDIAYSTLKSRVQKSRDMLKGLFDECCSYELDHQGRVMDYKSSKNKGCC